MGAYGWDTCPGPLRAEVDALIQGCQVRLGSALTGLYLHGSLAMGCFNESASDIDVLIVTARGLLPEERQALGGLLLAITDPRMHAGSRPVEISFLAAGQLRPWSYPTPYELHYGDSHRERFLAAVADPSARLWQAAPGTDPDLAAHIAVTKARGVRLNGAPIAAALPDVPRQDVLKSILQDVFDPDGGQLALAGVHPTYAVLNACRTLAYLHDGLHRSKAEGGDWGLDHLPAEHQAVVRQALSHYRGAGLWTGIEPDRLLRFSRYLHGAITARLP